MKLAPAVLLAFLAGPALADGPPAGVYVSDTKLCPAIVAGDYSEVSATNGVAVAPLMGILGGNFRCNFSASADAPGAVEARCLGEDGLFDDQLEFTVGEGTLDIVSPSGRMETADGDTRFFLCDGARPEDFPLWDGIEY